MQGSRVTEVAAPVLVVAFVLACGEGPRALHPAGEAPQAPNLAPSQQVPVAEGPTAPAPEPAPVPALEPAPALPLGYAKFDFEGAQDYGSARQRPTKLLGKLRAEVRAACPDVPLAALGDVERNYDPDALASLSAKRAGSQILLEWSQNYGDGNFDAYDETKYYIYDLATCEHVQLTLGFDGSLQATVEASVELQPFDPDSLFASLVGEWAICSDTEHAFACMLVGWPEWKCNDQLKPHEGRDWDVVGLTNAPSVWTNGPMSPQAPTYWPKDARWRARGGVPARGGEDLPQGYGYTIPGELSLAREVDGYRLYSTGHLPTHGPGVAFVVEDVQRSRHQWVGHTRDCLLGDDVEWLLGGDELVVGYASYSPRGPTYMGTDGLFVIDLREGTMHRLLSSELARIAGVRDGERGLWDERVYGHEGRERLEVVGEALKVRRGLELTTKLIRARIEELRAASPD